MKVGPAADIYSLGGVLIDLLTHSSPWQDFKEPTRLLRLTQLIMQGPNTICMRDGDFTLSRPGRQADCDHRVCVACAVRLLAMAPSSLRPSRESDGWVHGCATVLVYEWYMVPRRRPLATSAAGL